MTRLRPLSRRAQLRTLLTGAGLALLSACARRTGSPTSPQQPAPAPASPPARLVAYLGVPGELVQAFETEIAAPYTRAYPRVTVELLPQPPGGEAGMREKLQVLIAAGTPPDAWEYATIAETMVRYGWLVPLDDYIRRDRVDLSVYPRTLYDHVARYQGKIWLLPYGHGGNTMVMACNRALFAEAGVALPAPDLSSTWTWDAWVEALRTLTRRQGDEVTRFGQGDPGSWVSYPMLWQTDWLTEDLKTVVCDSPEMIECYTRYFALATTHRVAPRPGELAQRFGVQNAIQAFNTGKAAMTNLPPYAVRSFTDQKYVDLALAPRPRARVSVPDVNWHSFGIIQGSKQVEAAWTLIRWLTDEARWARFVYKIPAQAALQRPWLEEQFRRFDAPRLEVITNTLAAAVPQTRLFRLTAWPQVSAAVTEAFARLWAGQAEPAAVLKDLKPQLQAIIDRSER